MALAADRVIIGRCCNDPWHRIAFNAVAPALSPRVGAQVFFIIARVSPLEQGHAAIGSLILPVFALTAIYFLLNSGLTAVAVALEAGQSPFQIWRRHFQWLEHHGSYYLTYHQWATREQVETAYPQFVDFLELKLKYDHAERFQSDWYRCYKTMLANALGRRPA